MAKSKHFYKENPGDAVWWVDDPDVKGVWEFSFDRQTVFNLFEDYPWELAPDQREIFDRENPYWKEFFKDRE